MRPPARSRCRRPLLPSGPGGRTWASRTTTSRSVRAATDIVAVISEHVAAQAGRPPLDGPVPVPQREVAARSRSTPRRSSTTASAAGRRATSSPSSARSSTSTSSAPSRSWPPSPASPSATRREPERGPQEAGQAARRRGQGRRLVPRAPAVGARRRPGPRLPALAGPHRRRRARLQDRLGARGLGRAGPGAASCPTTCSSTPGSGFMNSRGRPTDAFRGRVLFPIFDVSGDPVGFGGRIMPGDEGAKYKNSVDSSIYNKSSCSTGSTGRRPTSCSADEVIVCEGYTDVIGFAEAGVPRAVATCGTALTEEHVKAAAQLRPAGRAGLRRRRRRPERGRAVLRVGAPVRPRRGRRRVPRRASTPPSWPRPTPAPSRPPSPRPSRSSGSASTGCSTPRRLRHARGAGPGRRGRHGRGAGAPQRPGPRPVPAWRSPPAAGSTRTSSAAAPSRRPPSPSPAAAGATPARRRRRAAAARQRGAPDRPRSAGPGATPPRSRRCACSCARRDEISGLARRRPCSATRSPSPRSARSPSTPTLADAVAAAGADDPVAGDLLQRLAVEETEAEVERRRSTRLVDEAADHAPWRRCKAEARVADDPFAVGRRDRLAEAADHGAARARPPTRRPLGQLLGWLTGRPEEEA